MGSWQVVNPVEIKQGKNNHLDISWQDGHLSSFSCSYLRKKCRCALCVDEWTGQNRINPAEINDHVHPLQIESVGRYGIRIQWSDGHNTGIYTFKFLKEICPCCQKTA